MPLSLKQETMQSIKDGKFTCVILRSGEILKRDTQRGINPLLDLNDLDPGLLLNSEIYDKIIGRAAAMIAVNCRASYVYGLVMSEDAYTLLVDSGIKAEFTDKVAVIKNRENTGMCPIEDSVKGITDIPEGIKAIRERVNFLKSLSSLNNK